MRGKVWNMHNCSLTFRVWGYGTIKDMI
jgi:hypothetical protein